jgi:SAM-dependent methyltransferase
VDVTERLSLEAVSEHSLIACEHVHRYELAARMCKDARVLDLACGTGYGSVILAREAKEVIGVDVDVATIETAQRTIGQQHPIKFAACDAASFLRRIEAGDVDVIVCFEGLEHVHDLDDVERELTRLASAGVKLVVSMPNSATWEEENPYHVTNFSLGSARQLLDRIGDNMLLVQNFAEGSLIVDPEDKAEQPTPELRWPERIEVEYANHFIGLVNVSEDDLMNAMSAKLELPYAPTYNRHIRNIEVANRELWRTNARLGWSAFTHSGAAAAARNKRADRHAEARAAADAATIAELSAEVEELRTALAATDDRLQIYIREAQRRANRPARKIARLVARAGVRVAKR